jgi:hypothetical protein
LKDGGRGRVPPIAVIAVISKPELTAEGGGATRAYLKPTAIWDHPGMIVGKSFGILVEG